MDKAEVIAFAVAILVVVILMAIGAGIATGRLETRKIFHASDSTDCLIVSRGSNVSVDCWIVEGEHEHGN